MIFIRSTFWESKRSAIWHLLIKSILSTSCGLITQLMRKGRKNFEEKNNTLFAIVCYDQRFLMLMGIWTIYLLPGLTIKRQFIEPVIQKWIFPENNALPCKICMQVWYFLMNLVSLHTFSPKLLKCYIFISILTIFLMCNFFGLQIWSFQFFDKFQLCLEWVQCGPYVCF